MESRKMTYRNTPQSVIVKGQATANAASLEPLSRTYQYRKVMKPLLERKRRARINNSMEDLKDIVVHDMQEEGENVSKLEKADILELAVRCFQRLNERLETANARASAMAHQRRKEEEIFREGFVYCAHLTSGYLSTVPKIDVSLGKNLMVFLGHNANHLDNRSRPQPQPTQPAQPLAIHVSQPTMYSAASSPCSEMQYIMPLTPSSTSAHSSSPSPRPHEYTTISQPQGLLKVATPPKESQCWRPW